MEGAEEDDDHYDQVPFPLVHPHRYQFSYRRDKVMVKLQSRSHITELRESARG